MDPQTQTIVRDWGIFLFQIFVLIISIAVVIFVYRYVRAILKRTIFFFKLKVFCKTQSIPIKKTGSQFTSIFKNTKSPELLIETVEKRYIIKYFTPSIVKNVNLNFITPNDYFLTSVKGFVLVTRNAGALIRASFFKPKNIESTFIKLTHTEIHEKVKGQKFLPTPNYEKYNRDGKETENILIINPIPLNIKYIHINRFEQLLGGDEYGNFKIYSTNEFYLNFVRNNQKYDTSQSNHFKDV